jgi:hypothetical protein
MSNKFSNRAAIAINKEHGIDSNLRSGRNYVYENGVATIPVSGFVYTLT